jgi:hypothetical protein
MDEFLFVRDFRGELGQFIVGDEAHIVGRDVEGFLEFLVVDLVPNAFFFAGDDDLFDPVCGFVEDAVGVLGVISRARGRSGCRAQ